MKWTFSHSAVVVAVLGGLGAMIAALPDWHTALSPAFIGGVLVMLGGVGKLFTTDALNNKRDDVWDDTTRAAHRNELGI